MWESTRHMQLRSLNSSFRPVVKTEQKNKGGGWASSHQDCFVPRSTRPILVKFPPLVYFILHYLHRYPRFYVSEPASQPACASLVSHLLASLQFGTLGIGSQLTPLLFTHDGKSISGKPSHSLNVRLLNFIGSCGMLLVVCMWVPLELIYMTLFIAHAQIFNLAHPRQQNFVLSFRTSRCHGVIHPGH